MKAREYNNKIEVLDLSKIITYEKDGQTLHIMPSVYATEESLSDELLDAGFQDVIDELCTENQYLGEITKVDGKLYRYAIDIQQPSNIELFDFYKFTSDLRQEFGARIIVIDMYAYSIMMNIQLKFFDIAKQIILGHIQAQHLTLDDFEKFNNCLKLQNINLDDF